MRFDKLFHLWRNTKINHNIDKHKYFSSSLSNNNNLNFSIRINFEYFLESHSFQKSFNTKQKHNDGSNSKKEENVNNCSPAFNLLKEIEEKELKDKKISTGNYDKNNIVSIAINNKKKRKLEEDYKKIPSVKIKHKTIENVTSSSWNLRAIAPLFVFLEKKGVKYCYSDIEMYYHDQNKKWYQSQKGKLYGNIIHQEASYLSNGIRNSAIRVTCEHRELLSNVELLKNPSETAFSCLRQHRIYKYNDFIEIHVTCGVENTSQLQLWIEIDSSRNFNKGEIKECKHLITNISRHLSNYCNHDKQYKNKKVKKNRNKSFS